MNVRLLFSGFVALGSLTARPAAGQDRGPGRDSIARPLVARESTTTLVGVRVVERADGNRHGGAHMTIAPARLWESHPATLHDLLRQVPGITVREEEGLGLRPNIGVRGLNPTRSTKVLLLEDGIPLAMAPYGDNATYYHPPLSRISSIEIVKGAAQIQHGPQTIGGVINYLTPPIPLVPQGTVEVTGGNGASGQAQVRYGGVFGSTGVLVDAAHRTGDGSRRNTHSDLSDASFKVRAALGLSQELTVRANYYGERSRVTYSGLTEAEYAADPRQNQFSNDRMDLSRSALVIAHRAGGNGLRRLQTTLYSQRVDRDWWRQSSSSSQRPNDRLDPACGGMENLDTACGIEGRLRAYQVAGVESRLTVLGALGGWQARSDAGLRLHGEWQDRRQVNAATPRSRVPGPVSNVNSGQVEDNSRRVQAVSGWTTTTLIHGRLTLTPGLRLEAIRLGRTNRLPVPGHAEGVAGTASLTRLLPGFGVSVIASPGISVFAGVHRGFAPPRPEDAIDNQTGGTVDLDAESSWNYEIGFRTQGDVASWHLTAFRMDFENQIVPGSVAGGTGAALTNAGRSLHDGVELQLQLTAPESRRAVTPYADLALTFLPTARFIGPRHVYVGERTPDLVGKVYVVQDAAGSRNQVSVAGNRLPYAPVFQGSSTLGLRRVGGWDVHAELIGVSRQFGDPLNTTLLIADGQQGIVPAHQLWNAAVTVPLRRGWVAWGTLRNAADRRYVVDRTRGILPGAPRRFQLGVRAPV